MFSSLPQNIQDELVQLSQTYGQPLVRTVDLGSNKRFDPINKKDRYGEVCMVVRRTDGKLLTMIKTFYPTGAYRLLTGGIKHGENVFAALLRETHEETGLEVRVNRFLAAVAYRSQEGAEPVFYTFAFLIDEVGGTLGVLDESEHVEGFLEIRPEELPSMAERLEQVGASYSESIEGHWSDWGHFRAVIHRLVWQALKA